MMPRILFNSSIFVLALIGIISGCRSNTSTVPLPLAKEDANTKYSDNILSLTVNEVVLGVSHDSLSSLAESFEYDRSGRETEHTNAFGVFTTRVKSVYSATGEKIREEKYNAADSLESIKFFRNPEPGLKTEVTRTPEGVFLEQIVYTFDDAGRKISESSFVEDSTKARLRFEYGYDHNGGIQEVRQYKSTTLTDRQVYDSDASGHVTRISYFFGKEATDPWQVQQFLFDDLGNKTETRILNEEGKLHAHTKYTYDAAGRVLSEEAFTDCEDPRGCLRAEKDEYTYDEKGRLLTRLYYETGDRPRYRYDYQYSWYPLEN